MENIFCPTSSCPPPSRANRPPSSTLSPSRPPQSLLSHLLRLLKSSRAPVFRCPRAWVLLGCHDRFLLFLSYPERYHSYAFKYVTLACELNLRMRIEMGLRGESVRQHVDHNIPRTIGRPSPSRDCCWVSIASLRVCII